MGNKQLTTEVDRLESTLKNCSPKPIPCGNYCGNDCPYFCIMDREDMRAHCYLVNVDIWYYDGYMHICQEDAVYALNWITFYRSDKMDYVQQYIESILKSRQGHIGAVLKYLCLP